MCCGNVARLRFRYVGQTRQDLDRRLRERWEIKRASAAGHRRLNLRDRPVEDADGSSESAPSLFGLVGASRESLGSREAIREAVGPLAAVVSLAVFTDRAPELLFLSIRALLSLVRAALEAKEGTSSMMPCSGRRWMSWTREGCRLELVEREPAGRPIEADKPS